jgi:hypothetical protein
MSADECLELTAMQYARLYGLATDHLAEPLPIPVIEALQQDLPDSLTVDTGLPNIELPIDVDIEDRLTLTKDAARLLQDASNGPSSSSEIDELMFPLLDYRQVRELRLELPLLSTDHASDFREFAKWEDSHIKDGCLPMEPLDDELDVSLEWHQRFKTLPTDLLNELKVEKIEFTKDTLLHLQATVKDCWTEEDDQQVWEECLSYKKVRESIMSLCGGLAVRCWTTNLTRPSNKC